MSNPPRACADRQVGRASELASSSQESPQSSGRLPPSAQPLIADPLGGERADVLAEFESRTEQMIAGTRRLVTLESPSNDIEALRECAAELARYATQRLAAPSKLMSVGDEERPLVQVDLGERPDVLLIGHFDTVLPIGTLADHPMRLDGNRLYGPGALDMKGGCAVMVEVGAWLQQHLGRRTNVTLLFDSDEEIGSPSSRQHTQMLAARSRAVLVFEFTELNGAMKIGRRGVREYQVTVHGRGGHAAYPARNRNPVDALAEVIVGARRAHDPDAGRIVVPTLLAGSSAFNVVPDSASVVFDVRVTDESQAEIVDKVFRSLRPLDPDVTYEVDTLFEIPAYPPQWDGKALTLATAARLSLGLPPVPSIVSPGASDANQAAAVTDPGNVLDGLGGWGEGAHSPGREYLDITSLAPSAAVAALICEAVLAGDA